MVTSTVPGPTFHALRLSLSVVYLYFGALKFFPNVSPAEGLATQTVVALTGGMLSPAAAIVSLAALEVTLGLALLLNRGMRWAFWLFMFHMAGTFTPLFLFPGVTFQDQLLVPTLEGQYILKNMVFVAAAWPVFRPYATTRRIPHGRGDSSAVPSVSERLQSVILRLRHHRRPWIPGSSWSKRIFASVRVVFRSKNRT